MATSKIEFIGYILEGPSSVYCASYRRKAMNTSGVVIEQFYWLKSNRSGDIIDFRSNALNGYYLSQASLLANYPAGYSLYTDNWVNEKYFSYMFNFPFEDVADCKVAYDEWVALGANNIVIPVFWEDIFKSHSAQITNSSGAYAAYDDLIDYAKAKGVKVSFSIALDMDDGYIPDFWGIDANEKDEWGYPLRIARGSGHPSLANATNTGIVKDFFQKFVARYADRLGDQLNTIFPVMTVHNEFGYNITNQHYSGDVLSPEGIAQSGYSDDTIAGFRSWLPSQYANVGALNTAWGTAFGSFSVVTPPTTGKDFGTVTRLDYANMFSSNRGHDWYKYLFKLLYDFAEDLRDIVSATNTTYGTHGKFVLAFGGVSPNDNQNINRLTWDVDAWGEISDGLKTAIGADYRNTTAAISLDYMQNYPGKLMTEIHHIDFSNNGSIPIEQMQPNMVNYGLTAMQNGVKDIMMIGMRKFTSYYSLLKTIGSILLPEFQKNWDGYRTETGSISVGLGELLSSAGQIAIDKWSAAGGGNTNRIHIDFDNVLVPGTSTLPYSLSLIDNQNYTLKQLDIKHSVYGRLNTYDSTPTYTPIQVSYNATRVPFLVPTHAITYASGTKAKIMLEIIDNNGVTWVKVVQSFGVTNIGDYANNHPEFRYLPLITEDCRFWLPITTYYDIKLTVYDAACIFEVYHADNDAPDRISFSISVGAGTSYTYRVNQANMEQPNIHQRVLKLNCNRPS